MNKTPLHAQHVAAGARMVDFGGWEMPINYGSQIDEHHAVRQAAGMFDVSHMTVVDLEGPEVRDFLLRLLANNVDKLKQPGKALYSCMLNEQGGVIDDLIVYFMDSQWYRLVVNAATRERDMAWIDAQAKAYDITVTERPELAMIALQGPQARGYFHAILGPEQAEEVRELKRFSAQQIGPWFVARTGYTGEDGYEIIASPDDTRRLWQELLEQSVTPCGLGARDTLRLEAAMNLYGQDMDETTHPYESNLAWTVAMSPEDRAFIGREALEAERTRGVSRQLTGLVLLDRGVLRHGQCVHTSSGDGEITSGSFSPVTQQSIALARLPAAVSEGDLVEVAVRNKRLRAQVVTPPFVRDGKADYTVQQ